MKLYKLTNSNKTTYNGTQWGENITHEAAGPGTTLCSNSVLHAYRNPYLAVLMNSAHGNCINPVLWEAKGVVVVDDGTKVGCKKLTTIRQLKLPAVTIEQRVEFAIRVALLCSKNKTFKLWASSWLDGTDRTAYAAAYAARAAAGAAGHAAAAGADAADAAVHAARAAYAAAYAARARTTFSKQVMDIIKQIF